MEKEQIISEEEKENQNTYKTFDKNNGKFVNQKFQNSLFSEINLIYAEFEACSFEACRFDSIILQSAKFTNCWFKGVQFDKAIMNSSVFTNCYVEDCSFHSSNLKGAIIKNSHFKKAKFTTSIAANMTFEDSQLRYSKMFACCLNDSQFFRVDFYKLILVNCARSNVILKTPINLYWTKELVSELLLQHSNGFLKKEMVAYLIGNNKELCWSEWRKKAEDENLVLVEWVKEVFRQYPESKLLEVFNSQINIHNE